MTSIEITGAPDKIKIGEQLNPSAIEVTATYDDDTNGKVTITATNISGFNKDAAGKQTVTVTYGGKTDTFEIAVLAFFGIEVEIIAKDEDGEPLDHLIVGEGESLDFDDIEVTAIWKNVDDDVNVIAETVSHSDYTTDFGSAQVKSDTQTVTVTYNGKTDTFEVLVLGVTEIKVTKFPNKTMYEIGEELDLDGLIIEVTFSDGETEEVHGSALTDKVTGFDSTELGEKTVTVTYGGQSDTFTVNVVGPYIITGSGTTFTATNGGATIGTASQPIQDVIDAIKAHADGKACQIEFGNGTDVLDIGTASISFNLTGGTWGAITLKGKITSATTTTTAATIMNVGLVSITSFADVAATGASNGRAFSNTNGTLTIAGGTVSTTAGYAINNSSIGSINISGGTVSATTGNAIYNANTGLITISGGTVTSENPNTTGTNGGTINLNSSGTATSEQLIITGGTVSNTVNNGRAVFNGRNTNANGTPTVNISGGTVSYTRASGYAIANRGGSSGFINISGGRIEATAGLGGVIENGSVNAKITISGNDTVISSTSGDAIVNSGTSGAVTITGGTFSTTTGSVIRCTGNNSTATISGNVSFTSAATTNGTVSVSGTGTGERLKMSDGVTVTNTSTTGTVGNAIDNNSPATLIIDGCTISTENTAGYAVRNRSTGTITITDSTITAPTDSAKFSKGTGTITVDGVEQ